MGQFIYLIITTGADFIQPTDMQILKYIFIGLLIFLTCGCGGKKKQGEFRYFRNYQRTFNDLNDKHLKAARQWGIQPVTSDELLEEQMGKFICISVVLFSGKDN